MAETINSSIQGENIQRNRTLNHPSLPQPIFEERIDSLDGSANQNINDHNTKSELYQHTETHFFVVCADTQLGMTSKNREWQTELAYSAQAIKAINALNPAPSFVCICGDLVDMEASIISNQKNSPFTFDQCHEIQDKQYNDFKQVWSSLHDRIPLVCLCGNHDVGNIPTRASIERFQSIIGDDYLAFWANGTYNIVLNNVLFNDPTSAIDLFEEQVQWLKGRLQYANQYNANQIFIFAHYPWFIYNEDEDETDMKGKSPIPKEWGPSNPDEGFEDSYFHIKKKYRQIALSLFRTYKVSACFSGHFHQDNVSKTNWPQPMHMITTAPLSLVFETDAKPRKEMNYGRGFRVVEVKGKTFTHHFESLR